MDLCTYCHRRPADEGYKSCEPCRDKSRRNFAIYRQRHSDEYRLANRLYKRRARRQIDERLCSRCQKRRPRGGYRYCGACRAYHRNYQRRRYDPVRITLMDKARAWVQTAPRTPSQLAILLDISPEHAASLLTKLRREYAR